jgi:long-chain acyl-CoA synthetase
MRGHRAGRRGIARIPLLKLDKFKVPDFFYEADALPVGRTGKADRRELRSMVASGALVPLTRHVHQEN